MTVATLSDGTPQNDQAFADAFAAAAAGDGIPPASDPAPAAEPAPAAAPAGDVPADGTGAAPAADPGSAPAGGDAGGQGAGGEAAAPGGTPAEPAAAPAAAEPAPAPATADEIVKGLADLLKQQPAPAAQPEAQPQAQEQEQAPLYSQEEISTLSDYEKNWPDVAQAESLKRRAEYHDLMKFVFSEVEKHTRPLFEQLRTVGNTLHMGELKQAVPDYSESLEAEVAAWVDTQPAYLQGAYKQVMQQGTSDEVADLIGRYRAATGTAPAPAPASAAPQVPAPAPAKPAQTELSSAAKQAAESLAPVSGDRSQVPQGEDPMDFASAFARYAAETMPK